MHTYLAKLRARNDQIRRPCLFTFGPNLSNFIQNWAQSGASDPYLKVSLQDVHIQSNFVFKLVFSKFLIHLNFF